MNVCEQTFFSEQKEMRTFNKGSSSSFKGELRHPETLSRGKVICAELKRHYPKEKDARSGKSVRRGHTAAGTGEECAEGTHSRRDRGGVGAEQQSEAETGVQNFGSCVVIWALSWQWETEKVWGKQYDYNLKSLH